MSQSKNDIAAQMAALRADMVALISTAIPAAVAAAVPAPAPVPVAPPSPSPVAVPAAAPARRGRKPAAAAAAPVAVPVAKPVPAAMTFKVEGWVGSDGQNMVTLLAAGRRKGQSFASVEAAHDYIDGICREAAALKAQLAAALQG